MLEHSEWFTPQLGYLLNEMQNGGGGGGALVVSLLVLDEEKERAPLEAKLVAACASSVRIEQQQLLGALSTANAALDSHVSHTRRPHQLVHVKYLLRHLHTRMQAQETNSGLNSGDSNSDSANEALPDDDGVEVTKQAIVVLLALLSALPPSQKGKAQIF